MSDDKKYSGHATDIGELEFMRSHNPSCGRCSNSGIFSCLDLDCPETVWSDTIRRRSGRSRVIDGFIEYAQTHEHRCDCTVSRKLWSIYDQQKQYETSRREREI